ncbi:hypothetical protein [Diaminobutyricibacter sp. McL0608]|uniref:hypothetical protein n=1 Tax=Leifsonia sp. McL0608 TaxID=3143537 RepID=UPI0031F2EFE3
MAVPAGTFRGGILIAKSLTLRGAGASKTTLSGGEHVITVGTLNAPAGSEPTVTISGITITGGGAHDVPDSDIPGIFAAGAGILSLNDVAGGGSSLTITGSVITGNVASPVSTTGPTTPEAAQNWPLCPDGYCPAAAAVGGGIYAFGSVTIVRSSIVDNVADGSLASDSDGAGIWIYGQLAVTDSVVARNKAHVVAPNGRYAEGGGIFADSGSTVSITRSSINDNESTLQATWPRATSDGTLIDTLANSGGIHVGDFAAVNITGSHIDGNRTSYDNPNGDWGAINAGLQMGYRSRLTMTDSTLSNNALSARILTDTSGPIGGVMEWDSDATITRSRFIGNTVTVDAVNGDASAAAAISGLSLLTDQNDAKTVVSDSIIAGNTATARTTTGRADVLGAGLLSQTDLTLTRVAITGNKGIAKGSGGTLLGGGIATGALLPGTRTDVLSALSLTDTVVSANALLGPTSAVRSGGGIYSEVPVQLKRTIVAGNIPDQCVGCGATPPTRPVLPHWHGGGFFSGRGDHSSLLDRWGLGKR